MLLNANTKVLRTCHLCLKVGHLARVCQSARNKNAFTGAKVSKYFCKQGSVKQVEAEESLSDSSSAPLAI